MGIPISCCIVMKICNVPQCDISDIMEVVPEKAEGRANAE
jgi:DNA-binding Xre family transcriptional regulator